MSAMVCQAPKKMKTPYFMVHIIIKNTCATSPLSHTASLSSMNDSHVCRSLACIDLSTSSDSIAQRALTWVTMAPEISCVNTVMD